MIDSIKRYMQALKTMRKLKSISQKTLSEKMGVPQSYLSNVENGKIDLRLSNFIELTRLLDHEVMLIPKDKVKLIESLTRPEQKPGEKPSPAYSLDAHQEEID
jgi:predicted transcriptional regulator